MLVMIGLHLILLILFIATITLVIIPYFKSVNA
jgi:hypothetical protein